MAIFIERIDEMPGNTNKKWSSQDTGETAGTEKGIIPDEDDLYGRMPKEVTLQFIVFRLDREWYGVDITKVKEVITVGKIAYLPSSPEHIVGMVNLRGNILSLTDLKVILRLNHKEPAEKRKIIAIESGGLETGFLVDEVVESIEVPVSKIEPALLTLPPEGARYIEGQCRVNGKLIALISVEKVLEKRA
ncbi:MAG: purine-binding chemotaxis protein CheW [Deltaproteobacteria bacterium]|nr:MAG: purine-binding chemotaxis protein CheW [Deltaproteobacteria bacterium]